jgi:ERCC4-related helicase
MDEDDFFDDDIDFNLLAQAEAQATRKVSAPSARAQPVASTSKLPPSTLKQTTLSSSGKSQLVQTTLDGNTVTAKTRVVQVPLNRAEKPPNLKATKVWDRSIWAKRGWGSSKAGKKKAKGKKRAAYDSDEDEEEEFDEDDVDFGCDATLNDMDLDPSRPPPPIKISLDETTKSTYIYPMSRGMRIYQYNIVRRALFSNVLVSLPTGLGKTFIAAAVMYNFWRWYPEGKIIFLAPTRPLVTQQIEACYSIAPIPPKDCAEMTGHDSPSLREAAWAARRVFYCTPQTVQNDLKGGRIDASKIVCLVIDEAHKASGDFAYCGVVRYLMSKNPHFRILALSATPGSTPEAVQAVIDALHVSPCAAFKNWLTSHQIGHIECRTDSSMDVQQYMHRKEIVQQVVPLTPEFTSIRDNWAAIMRDYAYPLIDKGVLHGGCRNIIAMSAYSAQMAMQTCGKNKAAWAFPALGILHKMAMAMEFLLTQSLSGFLRHLKELVSLCKEKGGTYKTLLAKDKFKICQREAEHLINAPSTYPHPKMDIMKTSLMTHFADDTEGASRAIVFCQYRDTVEEIVDVLNRDRPLLKATRFVGQGTDKAGKRGIAQKEQVAVSRVCWACLPSDTAYRPSRNSSKGITISW